MDKYSLNLLEVEHMVLNGETKQSDKTISDPHALDPLWISVFEWLDSDLTVGMEI